MTRTDAYYFAFLFLALLVYAVVRGMQEAQKYGPREDNGCPEAPYIPPAIIKHKAVKDRMALRRSLHAREVAQPDQEVHRG